MALTGSPTGCAKQLERWRGRLIESWGGRGGRERGRVRNKEEWAENRSTNRAGWDGKLWVKAGRGGATALIQHLYCYWLTKECGLTTPSQICTCTTIVWRRCCLLSGCIWVYVNNTCSNTALLSLDLSCTIIKCTATQAGWCAPLDHNQFNFDNTKATNNCVIIFTLREREKKTLHQWARTYHSIRHPAKAFSYVTLRDVFFLLFFSVSYLINQSVWAREQLVFHCLAGG